MKTILSKSFIKLIQLIPLVILIAGCGNSSGSEDSDSLAFEEVEDNNILLSIEMKESYNNENDDYVTYDLSETADSISINPDSKNFRQYSSNSEMNFHGVSDIYCSDYISNPTIYVHVVNNSNRPITFDKLRVNVESSTIDKFPYLYIPQLFESLYQMEILNECWADWGTMTLEYSFDKMGQPFNGRYEHVRKIPYFSDQKTIDFRDDLISEGLDANLIEEIYDEYWDNGYSDLSAIELSELAYPFEYSYEFENAPYIFARIHARLSFSNSSFTKKITGEILITPMVSGGAEDELVDKFDVELKPEGSDYYFELPYIGTLQPGDSERIQVTIKCEKSSHHIIKLQLTDQGAVVTNSKPIKFYNLNGRHSEYHVLKSY